MNGEGYDWPNKEKKGGHEVTGAKLMVQSPWGKAHGTKPMGQSPTNGINQAGSCYKYPHKLVRNSF